MFVQAVGGGVSFTENGFEIRRQVVSESIINRIKQDVSASSITYPKHGIRQAEKKFQTIYQLTFSDQLLELAKEYLNADVQLVRTIFFDKTPDTNWLVTWHQDKTIALNSRQNIEGWGPWSIKDGIDHVQPPEEILKSMVTFRLHLDAADTGNGCLRVIPGSHSAGILSKLEISNLTQKKVEKVCEAEPGDLLVMSPLLVHASSKSIRDQHRRVLHIEYSHYNLPKGLSWAS